MTDAAVAELAPRIGVRAACDALGTAQASYYRRHRTSPAPARPAPVAHRDRPQPRALSVAEQQAVLQELHSARFADMAPAEVWAILLDEGRYLGSISTFYRLLRRAGETNERRRQATHPATVKPELVATTPSGSSASHPSHQRYRPVHGSIRPTTPPRRSLNKCCPTVPHSG